MKDDEESSRLVQRQWCDELDKIDQARKDREAERQALGRVLEESNEADRALTHLSASAGNVHLRWQQGQFVGGGTFGSVYVAINLDIHKRDREGISILDLKGRLLKNVPYRGVYTNRFIYIDSSGVVYP